VGYVEPSANVGPLMEKRMKVLIADDHELVRDTIAYFLEQEPDITVDRVSNFNMALQRIEANGPYDLVFLDFDMPGMNQLDGLTRGIEANAGKPVAIISGTAGPNIAEQALEAGAAGFLPKSMSASSLIRVVRFMAAGEQYAPIRYMMTKEEEKKNPLAERLSAREVQVLDGICRGMANKEIARELLIQEVTVKLHVKTLCRKLNARNRTQAAMIAHDFGLA
jgi:two-component system nitrate/nitrite response regulator NarL